MSVATKHSDSFYFVHAETGQRYTVRDEIVIGRSHGEIVFARDAKLSSEHCRIVGTEGGVLVYDLGSANGTFIDGKKIEGEAAQKLVPGGVLRVGEQELELHILSIARLVKPRKSSRKKKKPQSSFFSYLMLLVLCAGAVYAFSASRKTARPVAKSDIPNDVLHELAVIFTAYDQLQSSLAHESAPLTELTGRFEKNVVMPLQGLSLRLSHTQLESTHDQILIDIEKEYAASFSTAVHDYTIYLQTGDTQYLEQMDVANDQMDQLAFRFVGLSPAMPLPVDLRSPQRLVEREMRKAFKVYRKIGDSMASDHLDKQLSKKVREELLPQLQAVFTRMGGIAAESPSGAKRLELEQRLVSAVIGQLKSVLLFAETREAKYAADSEHWLTLIQKHKSDLKELVARQPASTLRPTQR